EYGEFVGENIEYTGPAVKDFSIASRQTVAGESVELSVEFALFEADDKTVEYVKSRTNKPFTPVFADADAEYKREIHIDLSKLIPKVVLPHFVPNNVQPADQLKEVKITQAYVGSCINGRLEDMEAVANVVKGKKVAAGVRLIVIPASYEQYKEALKAGYIETIVEANGVVGAPGCGMCGGGSLGPEDVCITASPRNFKGRMGHPDSLIYLGSPATVAASAITGVITDPRTMA
ncbi:MAG: 3-isopropylmalate dehydratase large subunit, partial [Chloroflexi bacterium]|nr:3-isopropylmalate dehydratase large subunit [Chloroflexota bacterium]